MIFYHQGLDACKFVWTVLFHYVQKILFMQTILHSSPFSSYIQGIKSSRAIAAMPNPCSGAAALGLRRAAVPLVSPGNYTCPGHPREALPSRAETAPFSRKPPLSGTFLCLVAGRQCAPASPSQENLSSYEGCNVCFFPAFSPDV